MSYKYCIIRYTLHSCAKKYDSFQVYNILIYCNYISSFICERFVVHLNIHKVYCNE